MSEYPTGITLTHGKYRVRLYVEGKAFHGGYHETLDLAITALNQLHHDLSNLPPPAPDPFILFLRCFNRPIRKHGARG